MPHLLQRSLHRRSPVIVAAKGVRLRLADGREIIDATGGAAVACIGHGDPRVVEAIRAQAGRFAYAHTGLFTSEAAEMLANHLVGDHPGGLSHAFFVSSGSEAVEAAMKIVRQYFVEKGESQRVHFIARRQSYHGATLGALGLSGHRSRRANYEPMLAANVGHVSPCFPLHYQGPDESQRDYVARLAAELEAEFKRVGPERVIGFCAEPIVGATTGCVEAVPGYLAAMRAVCARHGALFILDEIMCGMGRSGTLHAWQQDQIAPDIQTIGKGLGGGYQPIGGVLLSARIVDALHQGSGAFVHGQTYQAHPVACAAALSVQRIVRDEQLVSASRDLGRRLATGLRDSLSGHPHVADIRGRGLFIGVEFMADRAQLKPFAPTLQFGEQVKQRAIDAGLSVYPGAGTIDGRYGDHVLLAPPFSASPEIIDEIVDRFASAVGGLCPETPAALTDQGDPPSLRHCG